MLRDGRDGHGGGNTGRSLLERVGPRGPGFPQEHQQPQIPAPPVFQNGMVPGVDMNAAMAAQMTIPLMLQEVMMNQMALMAQMAGAMGMVPPGSFMPGQPGFQEMGMANGMNNGFVPPHQLRQQQHSRRRGPNNRGQKPQREEQAIPLPNPHPLPVLQFSLLSRFRLPLLPYLLNRDQLTPRQNDHSRPPSASTA